MTGPYTAYMFVFCLSVQESWKLKNALVWDVTPCGSFKNRNFGGKYRHRHRGGKNQQVMNQVNSSSNLVAKLLLSFSYVTDCFHPHDGGDTFFRNFGPDKSHKA
jgi:hypothetical protein